MKRALLGGVAVFIILLTLSPPAFADLVYNSGIVLSGTGLGHVNTITTAHETTQGIAGLYETGCVTDLGVTGLASCPGGFAPVDAANDENAINQLIPFSAFHLGTVNGGELAFVFNIAETGQDLQVTLWNLFGELISSNGATQYFYFTPPLGFVAAKGQGAGTGQSAFGFELNAAQAGIADAFILANCGGADTCSIGGGFTANGTDDGPETLFVISTNVDNPIVPEPASIVLLGGVLLFVGAIRKRFV